MKLLVADLHDFKRYVSREFYFVMRELIVRYGWKQITSRELRLGGGSLKQKIARARGETPDVILFWEEYEFINHHARQLLNLDCKKCILADDLHWWRERARQRNLIAFLICDTILATYAYAFDRFYPNVSGIKNLAWVPHSASPDFILDFNPGAENAILLSGKINEVYPLRQQVESLYSDGKYKIVKHQHPGHHCEYDYDADQNVGEGYARLMNQYRAGFTDCSKFRYVVAKHFEIPATGALLVAEEAASGALRGLGFVDNIHYVSVSAQNLEEKIRFVLDESNHAELDRVRKRGQALVWERHKASDRARLINEICDGGRRQQNAGAGLGAGAHGAEGC